MSEKHYKKQLSAYLNGELKPDEQQIIAKHLLQCDDCRKEQDEIRFGTLLAGNLKSADAPQNLWNQIENSLNETPKRKFSFTRQFSFFKSPIFALILLFLLGFSFIIIYRNFNVQTENIARNEPQVSTSDNKTLSKQPTVWTIEALAGTPLAGNQKISTAGNLAIGDFLETDANSRARIEVADIGDVEIEPNSRVKLVNTNQNEHRLSLERGILQAKILAPPRLFIVDTPSATAIDLGCEYTLEVDREGNNRLHVTSGYVSLERDNFESIVPAGAICLSKKGKGLGTPVFSDASPEFKNAVFKFDFENGGNKSLQIILTKADPPDSLTLWHLLSRVPENEREKIFNKLVSFTKLPTGTTREGILRLDKEMLEKWRIEMEELWFEGSFE